METSWIYYSTNTEYKLPVMEKNMSLDTGNDNDNDGQYSCYGMIDMNTVYGVVSSHTHTHVWHEIFDQVPDIVL